MRTQKLLNLLTLIILAAMLLSACSGAAAPAVTETPTGDDEIQPVINATGAVVPAQWSALSLSSAGVIAEVLVEEGQQVQPGQPLVRLEGQASLQAAVAAAEYELQTARQALEDLQDSHEQVRAQAQLRLASAAKALDKASDRREGKNYRRADQSLIDSARADWIMAKDDFKRAEEVWGYFEGKDEEDVNRAFALSQYSASKRKLDQAVWNLNYLESMPDELEVNLSEGELVAAKAEYDTAQREWERVKNGPDSRQVSLSEARIKSAEATLSAARESLDRLELKAPFAGTVSRVYLHRQEWAAPGQAVLLLADLAHLRVETTDLNEIDAARINLNDLVSVTFDSLPDVRIIGKVARIGSKAAEGSGVTYPVVIELAEVPPRLRWGMTAFVDIEIKK